MIYKKFKFDKEVFKIMSFTILTLISINTIDVSNSHSRYYREGSMEYKSTFTKISKDGLSNSISLSNPSTYEEISISLNFNRNEIPIRENEQDTYTLNIPEGCSAILSNIVTMGSSGEINQNRISYIGSGSAQINAKVTCQVPKVVTHDEIIIPISISEKVSGDISDFIYMSGTYTFAGGINEYYKDKIPASKDIKILKNAVSIYDELKYFIENGYFPNYVSSSKYINASLMKESVLNYIKFFEKVSSANIGQYKNALDGITIDDSDELYYTFKIKDNFIGYALTYNNEQRDNMYFLFNSNPSIDSFNTILNKYIERIFVDDVDIVKEYLKDKDVYNFIINGTGSVNGLIRNNLDNDLIIININNLLDEIAKQLQKLTLIEIKKNNEADMYNDFVSDLSNYYFNENIIDSNLVSKLKNDFTIYSSITKNHVLNATPYNFTDYFILAYTNSESIKSEYAIMKVYSEGGNASTFVEIKILTTYDDVIVSFTKTEDTVGIVAHFSINLEQENVDNLTTLATEFTKIFGDKVYDLSVKTDESSKYIDVIIKPDEEITTITYIE